MSIYFRLYRNNELVLTTTRIPVGGSNFHAMASMRAALLALKHTDPSIYRVTSVKAHAKTPTPLIT